ncbi:MAG: EamA family transporter [Actinomycetota bacterium]|nr:EamA family transporter [Actinomycetota bacterium]
MNRVALRLPTGVRRPQGRALGLSALAVVILLFSGGSTLVKLAHTPALAIAFWRMLLCCFIWVGILRISEHRWLAWSDIRPALLPGIAFGLNIAMFFNGVTKTSVASAEFTGSLTPLIVVPLGALLFHERLRPKALVFGLISLAGLAIVLFNAPPAKKGGNDFSWTGIAWIGAAVTMWATYMLTSRTLRQGRTVAAVMAAVCPIAAVITLAVGLVFAPSDLVDVTGRSVVFIVLLAVLTGTLAHGLMVFAQHSVPIGVISMLQVSQPALSVLWSVLLLDASVRGIQLVGMALVIVGLVLVTVQTQRSRD